MVSTGSDNTAIGCLSLYSNTSGYDNVAGGYGALYTNNTGYDNVANGDEALYSNTSGSYNVANGYEALYTSTTAYYNTANGYEALLYNSGSDNTAAGAGALQGVVNSTDTGSDTRPTALPRSTPTRPAPTTWPRVRMRC